MNLSCQWNKTNLSISQRLEKKKKLKLGFDLLVGQQNQIGKKISVLTHGNWNGIFNQVKV